ncbi:MAG: DUF6101 family protein [Hyphomicrobiales bacterium]
MRQTEMAGATVQNDWIISPQENFRLNPAKQHQVMRTQVKGSALVGETEFEISDGIVVEGKLNCGLTTRVACKASSYRGVAAKLSLSDDDQIVAELILLHSDASLNMPLARSNNMDELAADWQMWGRRFNLALILIEPDGVEQMVSNRLGSLDVKDAKARRPSVFFRSRRPRFLTKRKAGRVDASNRIAGREIIART